MPDSVHFRSRAAWFLAGCFVVACGGKATRGQPGDDEPGMGGAPGMGGTSPSPGVGGTPGIGGDPSTGGAPSTGGGGTGGTGGSTGGSPSVGGGGSGGSPTGGGPGIGGGPSSCSETVTFEKTDYANPQDSRNQDCIMPDVCITRDDARPLFNAAVEPEAPESCSSRNPAGTEWALGTCSRVLEAGTPFGPFISSSFAGCAPPSIVGEPGCLHLIDYDLYYDIEVHSWTQEGEGGGFSYTRTLLPCGIPNATCVQDADEVSCICTDGYEDVGGTCVDIDECARGLHECHASASCDNFSGTYGCSCDTVSFEKEPGSDPLDPVNMDCITENVCLARMDTQSLFNAVSEMDGGTCGSNSPAGTLWARGPCATASVAAFGPFLSDTFADCEPPSIVGRPGCLWLLEDNLKFDIEFESWSGGDSGGGFAYIRRLPVDPGEACE